MLAADRRDAAVVGRAFLAILRFLVLAHDPAHRRRVRDQVVAFGGPAPELVVVEPGEHTQPDRLVGARGRGYLFPITDAHVAVDLTVLLGRFVVVVDPLVPHLARREREFVPPERRGEAAGLVVEQRADAHLPG